MTLKWKYLDPIYPEPDPYSGPVTFKSMRFIATKICHVPLNTIKEFYGWKRVPRKMKKKFIKP